MRRLLHSAAIAAILGLGALTTIPPAPAHANVVVGVSVGFPPPPLPYYDQPPIPGPGYIWTPGYWAWDGFDYYWVPGTWVLAPEPGFLWTPAFWDWDNGAYLFHAGYWGLNVGFYGGIDYGFGYAGYGYEGGYWDHDRFFYNRTVNNISNVNITNVYNRPVSDPRVTNVSYHGGPGGLTARPTSAQIAASRGFHLLPTSVQQQHQRAAAAAPLLHAANNHGVPPIAATARPGVLRGPGVVSAARSAPLGRGAAFGPGGAGQRGARGAMASDAPGAGYSQRFSVRPGGTQGHASSAFAARPAQANATPYRTAPPTTRVAAARPGFARSAGSYGVPASAETFRGSQSRHAQSPSASRAYSNYRPSPSPSRALTAPPRATHYAARAAPGPYGGGGRSGPPPAATFRAAPRMAAPSIQSHAAPARAPQGQGSPRRQPPR